MAALSLIKKWFSWNKYWIYLLCFSINDWFDTILDANIMYISEFNNILYNNYCISHPCWNIVYNKYHMQLFQKVYCQPYIRHKFINRYLIISYIYNYLFTFQDYILDYELYYLTNHILAIIIDDRYDINSEYYKCIRQICLPRIKNISLCNYLSAKLVLTQL